MKYWSMLGILGLVVVAGWQINEAQAADQPVAEIISGEVISYCNFLARGNRGEENKEVGTFLVEKKGLPVAILEDGTEQVYVAILKGNQSANKKLGPLMGMKVNAKGFVYRHNGANLIEIQIVSEQ